MEDFIRVMNDLAFDTSKYVAGGVVFLVAIGLTIRMSTNVTGGFMSGKGVNFSDLFTALTLAVVLGSYPVVMGKVLIPILDYTVYQLNQVLPYADKAVEAMDAMAPNAAGENGKDKNEVSLMDLMNGSAGILTVIGALLAEGIQIFARLIVLFLSKVLTTIYIAIGPLAFALSLFPLYNDQWKTWLKGIVNVALWPVTVAVIDSLIGTYQQSLLSSRVVSSGTQELTDLAVQIAFGLCYLMVPVITNLFASGAGGEGLMSQFVQSGSTILSMARAGSALATKATTGK